MSISTTTVSHRKAPDGQVSARTRGADDGLNGPTGLPGDFSSMLTTFDSKEAPAVEVGSEKETESPAVLLTEPIFQTIVSPAGSVPHVVGLAARQADVGSPTGPGRPEIRSTASPAMHGLPDSLPMGKAPALSANGTLQSLDVRASPAINSASPTAPAGGALAAGMPELDKAGLAVAAGQSNLGNGKFDAINMSQHFAKPDTFSSNLEQFAALFQSAESAIDIGADKVSPSGKERAGNKSPGSVSRPGLDTYPGGPSPFADNQIPVVSSASDAPVSQFDHTASEQVDYWVSQSLQDAQISFEGLSADRVDVKISMKGNETHVEFRSDHDATRQVLENAVPHLSDMLSREGLVLAGVSVGVGNNDASGQHGPARKYPVDGRRGRLTLESVVQDELKSRPMQAAGMGIDLFV